MLILASGSPRRREMFDRLGLTYQILSTDVDERVTEALSPAAYVECLAARKAEAARSLSSESDVILAADTVVAMAGRIFGKPADFAEAKAMLTAFSGKTHQVYTGFALCHNRRCYRESVATEVTFRSLSEREIDSYIEKEKPYDKAGAYGIQERAGIFVLSISGSFDNVVGLPLTQVELALQREFSLSLFDFEK